MGLDCAQIVHYSTEEFPFSRVLEAMVFKVQPLHLLHRAWRRQKAKRYGMDYIGYADNLALRALMQRLPEDAIFIRLYHRFVLKVVASIYGGKISYSNRPKMRVHLADTPKVSAWHRDVDITGRPDQINAFLPFTPCFDTNTLWCESTYGRGDYAPIPMKYGELYLFDGGYLSHGTVPNETDSTRVSLDFRFAAKHPHVASPWSDILASRPAVL